jgi:hypothetical protein
MQKEFLRKYVNALPGGVKVDLPILESRMPKADGSRCVDDNQKIDLSSRSIPERRTLA